MTWYVPGESAYGVPPEPGCGLPATSAPPARTWIWNSAGASEKPWSLTTVVVTVRTGATYSKAPMSHAPAGRGAPRWSVGLHVAGSAALIAGLLRDERMRRRPAGAGVDLERADERVCVRLVAGGGEAARRVIGEVVAAGVCDQRAGCTPCRRCRRRSCSRSSPVPACPVVNCAPRYRRRSRPCSRRRSRSPSRAMPPCMAPMPPPKPPPPASSAVLPLTVELRSSAVPPLST